MKKISLFTCLFFGWALITLAQSARVQIIHNSSDHAADSVDVWLDNTLLIDNFAFRTSTPFVDVTAGTEIVIGIAPANSTSADSAISVFPLTLVNGETYVIVANGILVPNGYTPAPNFSLDVFPGAREMAMVATKTDVLFAHGVTDAPAVDIAIADSGNIANNVSYGEFSPYVELSTADYTMEINDPLAMVTLGSFQAPFQTMNMQGQAIVVVGSGFANPANNNDGPEFGLWVATPQGGPMQQLSNVTSVQSIFQDLKIQVYPNPSNQTLNISMEESVNNGLVKIIDITGRQVYSGVLRGTKTQIDVNDFQTGVYFVNFTIDQQVYTKKLVIR